MLVLHRQLPDSVGMIVLVSVLAGTVAAVAIIAGLVHVGFRDGDRPQDARVQAEVVPAAGRNDGAGTWIEATVINPAPATALVALALRRSRFIWTGAVSERRTGGRRVRLALADQVIGAVPAQESGRFWLWAEGELHRLRLVVAVGTPGRLRLHRIPIVLAAPAGERRGREAVAEADEGRDSRLPTAS